MLFRSVVKAKEQIKVKRPGIDHFLLGQPVADDRRDAARVGPVEHPLQSRVARWRAEDTPVTLSNGAETSPNTFLEKRLRRRVSGRIAKRTCRKTRSISATALLRLQALFTVSLSAPSLRARPKESQLPAVSEIIRQ